MNFIGFENYFLGLPLDQEFDFNHSRECPVSAYLKSLGYPDPHARYETFHFNRRDDSTRTYFTEDFRQWNYKMETLSNKKYSDLSAAQPVSVQEILKVIGEVKNENLY